MQATEEPTVKLRQKVVPTEEPDEEAVVGIGVPVSNDAWALTVEGFDFLHGASKVYLWKP